MKFDTIEYKLVKHHAQFLISSSKDASVTIEAIVSEERLVAMYRNEFTRLRFIPQPNGNSPYFKPTSGYIPLEDWATENLNEKRAWEIWEGVTADEVVTITND